MRSLILALGEMAKLEQERAAEVHPPFASAHEGFAHIQEEKEEAKAELDYIEVQTGLLWGEIKRKGIGLEAVDRIEDAALRGAAELVQLAGVCRKDKESAAGFQKPQRPKEIDESLIKRLIDVIRSDLMIQKGENQHGLKIISGWTGRWFAACPSSGERGRTGGTGKRNQVPQSVRHQYCHDGEGAGKGVSSYQGNDH